MWLAKKERETNGERYKWRKTERKKERKREKILRPIERANKR